MGSIPKMKAMMLYRRLGYLGKSEYPRGEQMVRGRGVSPPSGCRRAPTACARACGRGGAGAWGEDAVPPAGHRTLSDRANRDGGDGHGQYPEDEGDDALSPPRLPRQVGIPARRANGARKGRFAA